MVISMSDNEIKDILIALINSNRFPASDNIESLAKAASKFIKIMRDKVGEKEDYQ